MISIKNTDTGKSIEVDRKTLEKGQSNSLLVSKNENYEIKFPIAPNNTYMSGKIYIRG